MNCVVLRVAVAYLQADCYRLRFVRGRSHEKREIFPTVAVGGIPTVVVCFRKGIEVVNRVDVRESHVAVEPVDSYCRAAAFCEAACSDGRAYSVKAVGVKGYAT